MIKEVVQETMREELRSILTEAVQIASTPSQVTIAEPAPRPHFETPSWVKELSSQQPVAENYVPRPNSGPSLKKDPMAILAETAKGMTRQDLSNFS